MGYDENQANGDQRYARYQRLEQRQNEKQKTNAASALLDLSNVQNIPEPPEIGMYYIDHIFVKRNAVRYTNLAFCIASVFVLFFFILKDLVCEILIF